MSDNYEMQVNDLRAELAEAKAANEALKEQVVAEQKAEFEEKIQALEATIAEQASSISEKEEALAAKEAELTEVQEALAEKEKDAKEKMEELREMKKKEAMNKRKAQLEEAGFEAEEALATVAEFEHLDDETFDKIVAMQKRKAAPKEDKEKAAPEEEKAVMKKKAELEEEVDAAEASEEVLENAEEPAEVAVAEAMGEEDPAENLRSVASDWLGSILQSNNK